MSLPTLVALNLKLPCLLIVAPITISPFLFSTGILSPVIIDSSTLVLPSIIIPSTGIFSPGLIIIISPVTTSLIGITISFLFLITLAVFACSPISFLIASEVWLLAIASRYLPKIINVIIMAAVS